MEQKEKHYQVNALQALVLVDHVLRGEDVDADRTKEQLLTELSRVSAWVPKSVLESALYQCNMADERKKFRHPQGMTFLTFLVKLLPKKCTYHLDYNLIKDGR